MAVNVGSVFISARLESGEFKRGVAGVWAAASTAFGGIEAAKKRAFDTGVAEEFSRDVGSVFREVGTSARIQFGLAAGFIGGSFANAGSTIEGFSDDAAGNLRSLGTNFTRARLAASQFSTGTVRSFKDLADYVGEDFSRAWGSAWNSVENGFKGVWRSMGNFFTGIMNRVVGGINTVLKGLNAMVIEMPEWLGGGFFTFNIPLLNRIPMLAKGGIVSQPTLAMVGERGKEAVLPLDNNTGWMDELAYKLSVGMAAQGGGQPGGGVVSLNIDGVMFAEAVIDDFKTVANRRGMEF